MLVGYKLQMTWRRWMRNHPPAFFNRRARATHTKPAGHNIKENKMHFIFTQCRICMVAQCVNLWCCLWEYIAGVREVCTGSHMFWTSSGRWNPLRCQKCKGPRGPQAVDYCMMEHMFLRHLINLLGPSTFPWATAVVFSIGDGHQRNLNKPKQPLSLFSHHLGTGFWAGLVWPCLCSHHHPCAITAVTGSALLNILRAAQELGLVTPVVLQLLDLHTANCR